MSDLSDLIARVEAASGPDRELDAEIAARLRHYPGDQDWARNWSGEFRATNGLVHLLGVHGSCGNYQAPKHTASIDAALTLLLEGWIVNSLSDEAEGFIGALKVTGCAVEITNRDDNQTGTATTRALALLSAILKARQAAGGRV